MAKSSTIKNVVIGATLSLVSIGVCLVVLEVILGFRYGAILAELESERKGELCTTRADEPALVYKGVPGKCGMNSRGYRDFEYKLEKQPGVFRVVVVGDSVAAGLGVELEQSFSKILETRLNSSESLDHSESEVVVLAQNGYSTSQQLILLENEVFEYSPDLVIWSYVLNDPAHPIYHDANGQIGQYHAWPRFHIVRFIKEKLFLVREKLRWRNCELGEYHSALHCAYRKEVRANIQSIGALAADHDVPVVFLIHPVFEREEKHPEYSLSWVHEELQVSASESGLAVLDIAEIYADHSSEELAQKIPSGIDPWHPNEEGQRLVAEALLEHLRQSSGLP